MPRGSPLPVRPMVFHTLRPSVQSFAQDMERVLRDNDHKGGWEDCDYAYLLRRLKQEVQELEDAIRNGCNPPEVLGEAIDVGNFAMMVAQKAHLTQAYNDAFPRPTSTIEAGGKA